jgi:hypothetical protein
MTILMRCLRHLTADAATSTFATEYSAFGF